MNMRLASTIGAALAIIAGTAAALGNLDAIGNHIPFATRDYVGRTLEVKLAGELEPLSRSLRVQSSKQASAEVNALEFQKSFLASKKIELEILRETNDSQIVRETLGEIIDQLDETKINLRKAKCDQTNISAGVDVECSK